MSGPGLAKHAALQTEDHGPAVGQTTSAARLMIFMNWRSRSSRAIAPKMRVPEDFSGVDQHHGVAIELDVGAVGAHRV